MSKLQAMPFFPADFFADTEHMAPEAAKAYLFLLGHAWLRGAKLPNDDRALARMARVSVKAWQHMKGDVLSFWTLSPDGYLRQKRLSKEHAFVSRKVEANRKNGSAGGKAKAAKKFNKNNEPPLATATNSPVQPTPTPTPIESSKEDSRRSKIAKRDSDPPGFDAFWSACPRKVGKGAAKKSYRAALGKTDADTLIRTMSRHAKLWARNGTEERFVPHPATWLNHERWNDEPARKKPPDEWQDAPLSDWASDYA